MFCEKCGKNIATTHIKTIVNGAVSEHNLCASCAAEEGYAGGQGGGLADMLISMIGGISPAQRSDNAVRCPVCHSSFADIAKTGKAGCTECYKTFYTDLLPYLKRLHGSVKHIGKAPAAETPAAQSGEEELQNLRNQLKALVSEERYEDAALVRDKIKELEGKDHE